MKNILLRTLTGLIYVVIVTGGILYSSYTFLLIFSIVTIACLWEFYGLVIAQKRTRINQWYNCFGGWLLFISSYLYAAGITSNSIFSIYLSYIVIIFISELYEKQQDPITHSAYIFIGQCYITLPLSLLNMIVFRANNAGVIEYNPLLLLALFVFIWVNDTGAYVTGSLFGEHHLFKRISPKKSWEGFFGGLLFVVSVAFAFVRFEPKISCIRWIWLSVLVAIFGTWGDLVESLIKRTLSIKDSGNFLPGHGGFLDRFDSLLLATYAVTLSLQLHIL